MRIVFCGNCFHWGYFTRGGIYLRETFRGEEIFWRGGGSIPGGNTLGGNFPEFNLLELFAADYNMNNINNFIDVLI